MKYKIAILGIGAIGSVISKELLIANRQDIDLFNRSPKSIIKVIHQNDTFEKSIDILDIPTKDKKYNLLILCLKEHQIPTAISQWQKLISDETKILVIRNGVNHRLQLEELGITNEIIPAIIDCPTQSTSNAYLQLSNTIITIPKDKNHELIKSIFKPTKIKLVATNNFHHDIWLKLCFSASLGATQCFYNGPCSIFNSNEAALYFFELLMESIAVANADNGKISKTEIQHILHQVEHYPSEKGSSMLTDFRAGRPIELGAKNGAILATAKKLNRPAKRNQEFVDWLKGR